jgi:decaprenylphospho-beta-D-ribofuranose 2-oxidase
MGRAYNDAAQRRGGAVLDLTGLTGFSVDAERGVVRAAAGVTLGALLDALVPRGFTVPVLPGTQHVSVGGAIASDIHGKNHGTAGSFGSYVEALGLLTADGTVRELTEDAAGSDGALFAATLGGMGLTGAVLWARVRLTPVSTPCLSVDTDRVDDLDAAFSALRAPGGPHRVAWLDLLDPRGPRGVVTRAAALAAGPPESARSMGSTEPTVPARATVPPGFPGALLRPASIRAFNAVRFRMTPRRARGVIEPIGRHMFPLDGLSAWPRLYGRAGLHQYQFVVPYGAEDVVARVIERLRASVVPCYLAVLKDFGPAGRGPLSFPIPGWTLAMDMPSAADGLDMLLEAFDTLVAEAGGRIYLAKDARARAGTVAAMYPQLAEWRAVRDAADPDGVFASDLALRTGLVEARR